MSLESQKQLIEPAGNLGLDLPGLNTDTVIENLANNSGEITAQYEAISEEENDNIERGLSIEEAQEQSSQSRESTLSVYKQSIRQSVIETIAFIKQQYKIFIDGLKSILDSVVTIISNIILPPSISTPPSAPNPVYATNLTKTNKSILVTTLGIIILAFTEIIKASNRISYTIPASLLALFNQLKTADDTINTIPL